MGLIRVLLVIALSVISTAGRTCDLALVLAVDVSGSVDAREYDIQMGGLAKALNDGIVVDALVDSQAMVTLIQWTGSSRQRQTIPWAFIQTPEDALQFAQQVADNKRVWRNFSTAIGEALIAAQTALSEVPQCRRKIIDVSGDGISNEGVSPTQQHSALKQAGIVVNALAIETDEEDLTAWFFENLIIGEGAFVETADGFADYPEKIKRKLQRETTRQLSRR